MKLLQLNTVFNSGSTGKIANAIAMCAYNAGWDSTIAFGRGKKNIVDYTSAIKIGNNINILLHGVQTRFFDLHLSGSKIATINFIRLIKESKPDVIHLHNIHGYYLNIPILFDYLKKTNIPVVWTLHDCWPITGHCCYFDYVKCNKWKSECFECPQINSYPSSWFVDNSKKSYEIKKELFSSLPNLTIVTVSDWLKNIVSESFLSNIETVVIKNGIDTDIFHPNYDTPQILKEIKTNYRYTLIGVANVWDRRKGLKDFIKLRQSLDKSYGILLVGLTKKQISTLPEGIFGLTRTQNINDLASLYSASDIFINPTHEDNFPTTNLEALACGTPVITYNTGGSPESIDEQTGIIVEKGNISDLVRAVKQIIESRIFFSKNQCRSRALELYDDSKVFKDYLAVYDRALKIN